MVSQLRGREAPSTVPRGPNGSCSQSAKTEKSVNSAGQCIEILEKFQRTARSSEGTSQNSGKLQ